ncbi:transcriptional regulator, HxlR family [Pseudomonas benzenivorans]|nr:helix-turn-helix domain-containing protein [Pseudomonas benzenivorans]SDI15837.1 transcriptional regulator, HxlR family [Pseudomonas benzenivorans]
MKGKRVDLGHADCSIARALQIIGDWWSLLIVREAFGGKDRFSEFQKTLGLARNILSTRLKKLVEEGILEAVQIEGASNRSRYVLTSKGEQLYIVLIALWQWGEQHCFKPGELKYAMVDRDKLLSLAALDLRAQDGRILGPRDFRTAARAELPASKAKPPAEAKRTRTT